MIEWIRSAVFCWNIRRIKNTRSASILWMLTHHDLITIVSRFGRDK